MKGEHRMVGEIKKHLIVSCQALEDEPLHSSLIMSRMAVAAMQGGAKEFVRILLKILKQSRRQFHYLLLGLLKETIKTVMFILHQLMKM